MYKKSELSQSFSDKLNVREISYNCSKRLPLDNISKSIVRDNNKCILCRRCIAACNKIQTVGAIKIYGKRL